MSQLPPTTSMDTIRIPSLADLDAFKKWIQTECTRAEELYKKLRDAIQKLEDEYVPRRLNQADIPASGTGDNQINTGELLVWRDSDNGKVYLVYNDKTSGVLSVELT